VSKLPGWVGQALEPGTQARNFAVDLSGQHEVGLEFRHQVGKIVFRAERSHLAAAMTYVKLESGWHCRLKLTLERSEASALFAHVYQGDQIQVRLFDLESEQGKLPIDRKMAAAGGDDDE